MNTTCCEVWRQIPSCDRYEASNLGRIRNRETGHIKTIYVTENGYGTVGIGKYIRRRVHVLVAEAFIGPKPQGMDVNHKDGVKMNNRADNLEYMTRSENCKHGFRLGLSYTPFRERGEKHCRSLLKDADVKSIREAYANGTPRRVLADKHGISYYTVWDITSRRSWTHI